MKKLILVTSLIIMCLSGLAFAETDVTGWQKIKWEMTKNEVLETYGVYSNEHKEVFLEEKFSINDQEFKVRFVFDANNIIEAVVLSPKKQNKKYISFQSFQNLIDLLTNKYGVPAITKKSVLGPYNTWIKNSGRIKIQWVQTLSTKSDSDYYLLKYSPNPKELDKI